MPDTRTPGQLCYDAYEAALPERAYFPAVAWREIHAERQRAFDAAAAAVRLMYKDELAAAWQAGVGPGQAQEATPAPPFRFAVGQRVTWDDAPEAVWQISACWQDASVVNLGRVYALIPAAGDVAGFRPLHVAEAGLTAVEEDTP
jgi:hypothetical protein